MVMPRQVALRAAVARSAMISARATWTSLRGLTCEAAGANAHTSATSRGAERVQSSPPPQKSGSSGAPATEGGGGCNRRWRRLQP